jgi:hypothetical protein
MFCSKGLNHVYLTNLKTLFLFNLKTCSWVSGYPTDLSSITIIKLI